MNKNMLISFEGGEACGKTTQIKRFCAYLESKGIDYLVSREPGGTEVGEKIREILLGSKMKMSAETEFLLFSASRSEHINQIVIPALEKGKVVILDRYYDSSYAYQGLAGNLSLKSMVPVTELAIKGKKPDVTFLLDVSLEEAKNRKMKMGGPEILDRMERKGDEYHHKVRKGYLLLAAQDPERIKVIDAGKTPDEVFEDIKDQFDKSYQAIQQAKEKDTK